MEHQMSINKIFHYRTARRLRYFAFSGPPALCTFDFWLVHYTFMPHVLILATVSFVCTAFNPTVRP